MTTVGKLKEWLRKLPDQDVLSIVEEGSWYGIVQSLRVVGNPSDTSIPIYIDTRASDDAGDDL